MLYRALGPSGLTISRIGFGCMSLGTDQSMNERLLHRALDLGINFFDTADLYEKGQNERMVGRALKGRRQQVILATKAGNQWRSDGSGWDWNPRKAYILSAAEASLKRLGTDYIDLYQLHGGTLQDPLDETISAFEQLKREGKIRHYGISSIRPNVVREWVARSGFTSVMLQYSLLDRRPEESLLPLLQDHGIGVLARGGLAQGLLAGKPSKPYLGREAAAVQLAAGAVQQLSVAGRSPGQTALQFVLHHPAVTAAVTGIRTLSQLEEAVNALQLPALTQKELETLQAAAPPTNYEEHR